MAQVQVGRCPLCLGVHRLQGRLPDGTRVCLLCAQRDSRSRVVTYSKRTRMTRSVAALKLIEAVREMAATDGALPEFRKNWVDNPRWSRVWSLIVRERSGEGERGSARWD